MKNVNNEIISFHIEQYNNNNNNNKKIPNGNSKFLICLCHQFICSTSAEWAIHNRELYARITGGCIAWGCNTRTELQGLTCRGLTCKGLYYRGCMYCRRLTSRKLHCRGWITGAACITEGWLAGSCTAWGWITKAACIAAVITHRNVCRSGKGVQERASKLGRTPGNNSIRFQIVEAVLLSVKQKPTVMNCCLCHEFECCTMQNYAINLRGPMSMTMFSPSL